MYQVPEAPLEAFHLPVSGGHSLYVHTYGNPKGIPVVRLHGGPGAGSQPSDAATFNPTQCHIILFDQRGCGQSKWPEMSLTGRLEANTTQHLVEDIEAVRQSLNIEKWLVMGTSWGSTLALAYAQNHPARVSALLVGAVLLGTQSEARWFSHPEGLPRFQPQAYANLINLLPEGTMPETLARTALKTMLGEDPVRATKVVRAWTTYEMLACVPVPDPTFMEESLSNTAFLLPHSLLEAHYMAHHWFLNEGQLLAEAHQLKDIPMHILQSAADMVCPPAAALALHATLPHSTLHLLPTGGHVADDAMKQTRQTALSALLEKIA